MSDASGPPMTAEAQNETAGVPERAQEKAQEAARTTQEKLREQLDRRSTEAGEKVGDTAGDLRSVGEELRKQGKDTPARIAEKAAARTERVGSYLKESDSDKMLADVEDFGRRQPLAMLAGGLVAGIAAARFLKASSRGRYQSRNAVERPTEDLGATMPEQPRGVYAGGVEVDPAGQESSRQAPVPSSAGAGR